MPPIHAASKAWFMAIRQAHSRYSRFADFGDGESYRRERENLRCDFNRSDE